MRPTKQLPLSVDLAITGIALALLIFLGYAAHHGLITFP